MSLLPLVSGTTDLIFFFFFPAWLLGFCVLVLLFLTFFSPKPQLLINHFSCFSLQIVSIQIFFLCFFHYRYSHIDIRLGHLFP